MRKIVTSIVLLLAMCSTVIISCSDSDDATDEAITGGIVFFQGTWDEALAQATKENKLVFLDAYASWCGPCKKMAPILFKIDEENKELNLLKIDADKNTSMTENLEFAEIPTMILYKNGKQVWRHTGLISEAEIKSKIY
jgi:thioredoxin